MDFHSQMMQHTLPCSRYRKILTPAIQTTQKLYQIATYKDYKVNLPGIDIIKFKQIQKFTLQVTVNYHENKTQ